MNKATDEAYTSGIEIIGIIEQTGAVKDNG